MVNRRTFILAAGLLPLAACNQTPAQIQSDVTLVANGLQAELPILLGISGLSVAQQAQINTDVQTAAAAAKALAGSFLTTGGLPTTFTAAVNDLLAFLSAPAISPLLPPGAAQVIAAAGALLPVIEASFGLTSLRAAPPTMSPDSARLILAKV